MLSTYCILGRGGRDVVGVDVAHAEDLAVKLHRGGEVADVYGDMIDVEFHCSCIGWPIVTEYQLLRSR